MSAKQPHTEQDEWRRRALDRHRPHHAIDVASNQQQVQNHVERIEVVPHYEQTELPVKQSQQRDNDHRGGKQTKQAVAEEPYGIGIGSEGTR
jgi:hypothetical protein